MAQQLAKAGVLQDGDIALTFRPELAGTLAYPHIQMGATHASLVYTKDGQAYNVDSPLDEEYVGQFNTLHFAGGPRAPPASRPAPTRCTSSAPPASTLRAARSCRSGRAPLRRTARTARSASRRTTSPRSSPRSA